MHRVDVIANGLDCQAIALLDDDVALDVIRRDRPELARAEERDDVVPQVRRDGHAVRFLAPLDLQSLAKVRTGLLHADPRGRAGRRDMVCFTQPAQLPLGLRLGQSVALSRGARRPDLGLGAGRSQVLAASGAGPARVRISPDRQGMDEWRRGTGWPEAVPRMFGT